MVLESFFCFPMSTQLPGTFAGEEGISSNQVMGIPFCAAYNVQGHFMLVPEVRSELKTPRKYKTGKKYIQPFSVLHKEFHFLSLVSRLKHCT